MNIIEKLGITDNIWGNKRLIEASPEMLEALIEYCLLLEGDLAEARVSVNQMRTLLSLYKKYVAIIERVTKTPWDELIREIETK